MSTVHPEPEFVVTLTPMASTPSISELKSLRKADAKASGIAISDLKQQISNTGNWIIASLEYEDVTEIKERIEGSSWKLNIETAEL